MLAEFFFNLISLAGLIMIAAPPVIVAIFIAGYIRRLFKRQFAIPDRH